MTVAELISYKLFIEDVVKAPKFQLNLQLYRATEIVKNKIKRFMPAKKISELASSTKTEITEYVEPETSKQVDPLGRELRTEIKLLFKDNLIVTGQQMTSRPQISELFGKCFSGCHSSVSISLLASAIDLHYGGLSVQSQHLFIKGLSLLASNCGQINHKEATLTLSSVHKHTSDSVSVTKMSQEGDVEARAKSVPPKIDADKAEVQRVVWLGVNPEPGAYIGRRVAYTSSAYTSRMAEHLQIE